MARIYDLESSVEFSGQTSAGIALARALRPVIAGMCLSLGNARQAANGSLAALVQVARALSAGGIAPHRPNTGTTLVHAILVELEETPLESEADGTLREGRTTVRVNYRRCAIPTAAAEAWQADLHRLIDTRIPRSGMLEVCGQRAGEAS